MKRKHKVHRLSLMLIVLGLTALGLWACDAKAADIAHPLNYRSAFISFTYPGNWKIADEQLLDYPYFCVIEDSGNAVTIVFTLEAGDDVGLKLFSGRYIDFFGAEMDKNRNWETGPSTVSAVETKGAWETVSERFTLKSLRAASPHTRTYRRRAAEDYVCYVVSQAPDADLGAVTTGFDQIADSLEIARKLPHGVE